MRIAWVEVPAQVVSVSAVPWHMSVGILLLKRAISPLVLFLFFVPSHALIYFYFLGSVGIHRVFLFFDSHVIIHCQYSIWHSSSPRFSCQGAPFSLAFVSCGATPCFFEHFFTPALTPYFPLPVLTSHNDLTRAHLVSRAAQNNSSIAAPAATLHNHVLSKLQHFQAALFILSISLRGRHSAYLDSFFSFSCQFNIQIFFFCLCSILWFFPIIAGYI